MFAVNSHKNNNDNQMLKEKKKFGFKTAMFIWPEWKPDVDIEALKKKYSRLTFITNQKQDLAGFKLRVRKTPIIKLKDKKIEDIFSQFKYESRHRIRKTYKIDELKFIADDKNFSAHYQLYKDFEYAQGRVPDSKEQLKKCIFFGGYYQGQLVSQVICENIDNHTLRVRNISSRRLEAQDKKVYRLIAWASRRVMYEAIKWGWENKFSYFDLNGVNFTDPAKKGITEFKLGFGGEVVEEYTYTYKKPLFKILEKLVIIKLKILPLINKIKKYF